MPNDVGYWIKRWQERQTGFHQETVNGPLQRHAARLEAGKAGERGRVLVPLCGKSHDLTWLAREAGHAVVGVEVAEEAVRDYFEERSLTAMRTREGGVDAWHGGGVTIFTGDFFALTPEVVGPLSAAYDRAALIAMPPDVQPRYASHLARLVGAGNVILLVGFDYEGASATSGPPFAIDDEVVNRLFDGLATIEKLEERDVLDESPRFRERGATWVKEAAYLLTVRSVA